MSAVPEEKVQGLCRALALLSCAGVRRTSNRETPWQICGTAPERLLIIPGRRQATVHTGTEVEDSVDMPSSFRTKALAVQALEHERAVLAVAVATVTGDLGLAAEIRADKGVRSLSPWLSDEQAAGL